jgi:hypothetical protein
VFIRGPYLVHRFSSFYINDLTKIFGNNSNPVIFVDDTNVIVSHFNHIDLNKDITSVSIQLNEWFRFKKKNSICAIYDKKNLWMKYLLATIICLFKPL